jgi:SulP family sulfate permease
MAQGVANFVSPFLGGMALTGTISRTVTNLRAGATTPVAGLVHAVCLLAIVWVLAPLAVHVPLSVLAGILWFVAWQIGDWQAFARLKSFSNHYRLMVMSAFLVTLIFDLTLAVELGLVLACVLFVRRQSQLFEVLGPVLQADMAQPTWRICLKGNLFFGAMNKLDPVAYELTQLPSGCCVVLDMSELWSLDTTGVHALEQWLELVQKRHGSLRVVHAKPQPLSLMQRSGFWQKLSTDGDA